LIKMTSADLTITDLKVYASRFMNLLFLAWNEWRRREHEIRLRRDTRREKVYVDFAIFMHHMAAVAESPRTGGLKPCLAHITGVVYRPCYWTPRSQRFSVSFGSRSVPVARS
jgi:hypothetical protein